MKITTVILFNRRNKINTDKTAPIDLMLYYKRQRAYVSTGVSVEPRHWSPTQCRVTKIKNADYYNAIVANVIARIEKYQTSMMEEGLDISLDGAKRYLINASGGSVDMYGFCISELDRSSLAYDSVRRNRSVLKTFNTHTKGVSLQDFKYESILQYDHLMRTESKLSSNTVIGHHKVISKFLTIAFKQGLIKSNPYVLFKIGSEKSDREALTFMEVAKLEKLKIPISEVMMSQVRDMFLFSCYTGLRFSDMQSLSKVDLQETERGYRINFKMKKVDRAQTLPLYALFKGKPHALLLKYADTSNTTIFPTITNQVMNRSLKSFALAIGTNVKLTSHIARHTFGTMLADITQNPYMIMQLMGHRDIKTSMIYIHLSQSRLEKQLDAVDWDVAL